ncbi:MAG: (Fe-S)-binding protein [Methanomicrobiales archaeon]|nr:(Fe-S)-binding protein [Methanomicrobiales archaeon]
MARRKYIKAERAKKLEKEMLTCTFCGFCKSVCPYFEDNQWDPSVARGKVILAYGLAEREIPADESVVQRLSQCTTCKDCERRCPSNIKVVDIVEAARADLVEAGCILPAHKKIIDNIKATKNPYGETSIVDLGVPVKKAEIGYFVGCTGRYRLQEIPRHAISILKKLNIDFTPVEEVCCGSTLQRIGAREKEVVKLMKANVDNIKRLGVKKVLFTCAGCLRMFKEEYPKHVKVDFEVEHLAQFLSKQNLKLKPFPKRIAYHDPCHLGRHLKIYDEPRKVLAMIPDAKIVEFTETKETARCCGGGGGVRASDPGAAQRIASRRVKSASDIADLLVTACPFCVTNLRYGNELVKVNIEIKDIAELVDDLLVT